MLHNLINKQASLDNKGTNDTRTAEQRYRIQTSKSFPVEVIMTPLISQ
jgi:hypothetical protein